MASYQARTRDPLLDEKMQAAIERRGKELVGIALLAIGAFVALVLGSYVPEDPSWLSATDEPARNIFGRFGAGIASPLFIIVGYASWAIAVAFLVWGARFVSHRGDDRVLGRVIFAPIAIAVAAIYASTHVPGADWTHSFGLGGLFGDTVLGAILNVIPFEAGLGLKVFSVVSAVLVGFLGLYVLGFDWAEVRALLRFMLVGVILTYASVMTLFGRAGAGTFRAAGAMNERRAQRRAEKAQAQEALAEAEARYQSQVVEPQPVAMPDLPTEPSITREKPGFLKSLVRRAPDPEPELVQPRPVAPMQVESPTDDRIKEKIASAIKSRVRQNHGTAPLRAEPPLVAQRHPRGPQPLIADPAPQPQAMDEENIFHDIDRDTPLVKADHAPAPQARQALNLRPVQQEPRKVVQHTPRSAQPSRRALAEAQPALQFEERPQEYENPPLNLLMNPVEIQRHHLSDEALEENARMLENVLDDYGVKGEIVSVRPGPVVTMYELEPAPGLKASRVIGLADDIARSMSALAARVSTVPGRSVIGIELPNAQREKVVLREILSHRDFGDGNQKLPLALGKDIGGEPVVANLAKMPHLLIAGTTGSGKSVAINTMILSLLYKLSPEECRLIMIDPKMLELSVYDGIPHLLSPVVTDPKKAVVALKWVVGEMEERYRKMSKMGVRNIDGYNSRVADALSRGEMFSRTVQTGFDDETGDPVFETEEFAPERMPYIVVVVDEMADLMMVAGKEIEACIQRLAQMARASGIHLIMATQRPSVDVITGTIKANFPTRISFQVTSKVDSRTILGEQGAEQLLGMGDMLYMAGGAKITRVHGPFVSDEEVEEIVNYLKSYGPPEYVGGVVDGPDEDKESDIDLVLGLGGNTDGEDALYDQAVAIVIKDRKCSTSYIQRKLAIGYNKAARLVEQMEDQGLVSAANHVGKREILVPEQQ
ncbi:MAG: DNA translocase FtsK 4TM domain-containing protein [Brevirhabdus sp.]